MFIFGKEKYEKHSLLKSIKVYDRLGLVIIKSINQAKGLKMNYEASLKPRLASLILRKYIDIFSVGVGNGLTPKAVNAVALTLESPEVTSLFKAYAAVEKGYDYKEKVKVAITAVSEGHDIGVVFRDLDLYSEYDISLIIASHYSGSLAGLERLVAQYNEFYTLDNYIWRG